LEQKGRAVGHVINPPLISEELVKLESRCVMYRGRRHSEES